MVRECLGKNMKERREQAVRLSSSLGKSALGRGNSLCKGPEVTPCLVFSIRKTVAKLPRKEWEEVRAGR